MHYYDIEDFGIVKYEVELNINKLNLLKNQIINDCSEIVHKSYETTNISKYLECPYIKNYLVQKTGKRDKNNDNVYLVSYDLYNVPYLFALINELLNGNTSVINEIKNYKECFFVGDLEISDTYNNLLNELNSIEDIKIYGAEENIEDKIKRKNLLKQLEELLTNHETKKRISYDTEKLNKYRFLVLNCINLKLINKISLEKIIEVRSFFEDYTQNEISENLQKVLSM